MEMKKNIYAIGLLLLLGYFGTFVGWWGLFVIALGSRVWATIARLSEFFEWVYWRGSFFWPICLLS